MYVKKGIPQKIIKEYSYKIMLLCKSTNDITEIQDFIKDEYINYAYLNPRQLYNNLLNVVLDVCNLQEIEGILRNEIGECINNKNLLNLLEPEKIDFRDLCTMLIRKLTRLKVREKYEDEYIDRYLIDINGQLINSSEYDKQYVENNENRLIFKRGSYEKNN